jgi:ATP-binding cassette subfamily B protein
VESIGLKQQPLQKSLPSLFRFVKQLTPYLQKKRTLIILSTLAMIAEIGLRLLEPWPLKWIFDRLSHNSSRFPFFDSLSTVQLLLVSAIAVVIFSGLRAMADYYNTVGFTLAGNHVLGQLRVDVFRHLQRLPLSFHTKAKSGDLVLRLTGDITMLKDIAVSAVLPLLVNFFVLISMVAVMFWLNWKLAIV